jgi:hypothetical protein
MSMGSDFTRFRMATREKIEQLERKNAELRAENIKLRERIAFETSINAELKERLENKTNSSN